METIKEKFKENALMRIICFFIIFSLIVGGLGYLIYYGIINIVSEGLNNNVVTMYDNIDNIPILALTQLLATIVIFNLSIYIIWKLTLHFSLKNFDNISNSDVLKYIKRIIIVITIIIVSFLIYNLWSTTNFINEGINISNKIGSAYNTVREEIGKDTEELQKHYQNQEYTKKYIERLVDYFMPVNMFILINVIIFNIISYFIVERAYYKKYANKDNWF